mmetsp:Transcript_795/g.2690  ORF Transcript_795/g.2690 Transcript_795/m.2690 type:complete len:410 (-) Transcript_795:170-1399(-)|eukprot:CAMPEP_0117443182 /NCGR_PEP_ID=MMETSP0759-20121206/4559_1 /TAXON_ID=63605 /ORGANISM="Percolomonas cosmopolitus, Strain WS" /LENGTH=409 /DNA_ID=CAMNT_0005235141 /DNA_START=171 /DNA_END=1400 /DNA_ORIENTATION=+
MPKQIISPKECLLFASILEKGQIKISQIKHPKYYRGEYEKIQDAFLLDPDFNFFRVRSEVLFMRERTNCLLFLYKAGEYYYTCIGTKNYRKRIAQNFLEELAEEHQKVLILGGAASNVNSTGVDRSGAAPGVGNVAGGASSANSGASDSSSSASTQLTALQKVETKKLLKQKFDHHNEPFNDVYLQGMKLVDENIDGVRLSLEKAALRAGQINELNDKSSRILDSTYTANSKSLRLKNTARGNVYKFLCIGFICVAAMVGTTALAVLFKFHIFDRLMPGGTPANPAPTPVQLPAAAAANGSSSSEETLLEMASSQFSDVFPKESASIAIGDFADNFDVEDSGVEGEKRQSRRTASGPSTRPTGMTNSQVLQTWAPITSHDRSLLNSFDELASFIKEGDEMDEYLDSVGS